jgi:hypothetical protein
MSAVSFKTTTVEIFAFQCGSVTFRYGSGFVYPYHLVTDPDPDPTLFVSGFQESTRISFFVSYFTFEGAFKVSKVKSHKEVTKQ